MIEDASIKYYNSIEDSINALLSENIKVSLFEYYLNGNVENKITIRYKGIPIKYLNFSDKIRFGLEIINYFSQRYDIAMPIFIDNSESITNINIDNIEIN